MQRARPQGLTTWARILPRHGQRHTRCAVTQTRALTAPARPPANYRPYIEIADSSYGGFTHHRDRPQEALGSGPSLLRRGQAARPAKIAYASVHLTSPR